MHNVYFMYLLHFITICNRFSLINKQTKILNKVINHHQIHRQVL